MTLSLYSVFGKMAGSSGGGEARSFRWVMPSVNLLTTAFKQQLQQAVFEDNWKLNLKPHTHLLQTMRASAFECLLNNKSLKYCNLSAYFTHIDIQKTNLFSVIPNHILSLLTYRNLHLFSAFCFLSFDGQIVNRCSWQLGQCIYYT